MSDQTTEASPAPSNQTSASPDVAEPWYQNWRKVLGLSASAPVLVTLVSLCTNFATSKMEMHNRELERAQIEIEQQRHHEEAMRTLDAKAESDRRDFNEKAQNKQLEYERDKFSRLDKLREDSARLEREDEAKLRSMQTHYIDLALARPLCIDDKVRIFGYVAAVAKGDEKAWAIQELRNAEKLRSERDSNEEKKRELLSPSSLEKLSRQLETFNLNLQGIDEASAKEAKNRAKEVIGLVNQNEALKRLDIPCTGLPSGLPAPGESLASASSSKH